MARPWSRKRGEQRASEATASDTAESVRLDDDDHAWWARSELNSAWKPREPKPKDSEHERDVLAEHFGEDWRTTFLYSGPSEEQREEGRRREQQALDDQDPYKVLQVNEDASWDEIVAAHRRQARAHHPDRLVGQSAKETAESEERIRIVNLAYQELRVRRGM